jgi:hypothetical protein
LKVDDLFVDIKLDAHREQELKLIDIEQNGTKVGIVSKGLAQSLTEKHHEFKNETVMNTMPYFLTSKYQEILEKNAIERKLKDSGMDFEQGPLEITPGQPIG